MFGTWHTNRFTSLTPALSVLAGGGRKVIRCEVSLDGGDSWRLADIERHERPTPYNKHWCWVFWSIAIPTVDLLRSTEIRVRAVDSSNNMMPEKYAPASCNCKGQTPDYPPSGLCDAVATSPCSTPCKVTTVERLGCMHSLLGASCCAQAGASPRNIWEV